MSQPRDPEVILASWRNITRELRDAVPGSRLAETLAADATMLREEYLRVAGREPSLYGKWAEIKRSKGA